MKKFQLSLRAAGKNIIASQKSVVPLCNSTRAYSTYRVKIKKSTKDTTGEKQHHRKSFLEPVNIEESTPQFFEHPDFKKENRYLISRIDILNVGKAPSNIPIVKELSNSQWVEQMKEKVCSISSSSIIVMVDC